MNAVEYHRVCNSLIEVAEAVIRMDFIHAEEKASFKEISPLCREMVDVTQSAASAASDVLGHYERYASDAHPSAPDIPTDDIDMDARISFPGANSIDLLTMMPNGHRQVVDLAWIGSWTLKQKSALLSEAVGSNEFWRALGQCLSAKRMVVKTTTAIERAVADVEGVPSRLAYLYETELDRSLQVRRLYVRFRNRMATNTPPDLSSVESRVRLACVSLAQVFGDPAYADVRMQDRQLFRKLQGQGLAWIAERKAGGDASSGRAGLRLWQELSAFAECLMMINNRSELRGHDKDAAIDFSNRIRGGHSMAAMWEDKAVRTTLRCMEGRDESLDVLIRAASPGADSQWLSAFERVASI